MKREREIVRSNKRSLDPIRPNKRSSSLSHKPLLTVLVFERSSAVQKIAIIDLPAAMIVQARAKKDREEIVTHWAFDSNRQFLLGLIGSYWALIVSPLTREDVFPFSSPLWHSHSSELEKIWRWRWCRGRGQGLRRSLPRSGQRNASGARVNAPPQPSIAAVESVALPWRLLRRRFNPSTLKVKAAEMGFCVFIIFL